MDNKEFDFPAPEEKIKQVTDNLINKGWQIDKSRWNGEQSRDFYKGMYACLRVCVSVLQSELSDQQKSDMFAHMSLDTLFLMEQKRLKLFIDDFKR